MRADLPGFPLRRLDMLARLRRVNAALARWQEYHAALAMPPELRLRVFEPPTVFIQPKPVTSAA